MALMPETRLWLDASLSLAALLSTITTEVPGTPEAARGSFGSDVDHRLLLLLGVGAQDQFAHEVLRSRVAINRGGRDL